MDGTRPQVIRSIEILVLHRLLQHHQLQPLTLIHHSEVKTVLVMDHDSGISVVLESHAVTLLKAVISENEGIQDAVVGILAVRPHEELQVIHIRRQHRNHNHSRNRNHNHSRNRNRNHSRNRHLKPIIGNVCLQSDLAHDVMVDVVVGRIKSPVKVYVK